MMNNFLNGMFGKVKLFKRSIRKNYISEIWY